MMIFGCGHILPTANYYRRKVEPIMKNNCNSNKRKNEGADAFRAFVESMAALSEFLEDELNCGEDCDCDEDDEDIALEDATSDELISALYDRLDELGLIDCGEEDFTQEIWDTIHRINGTEEDDEDDEDCDCDDDEDLDDDENKYPELTEAIENLADTLSALRESMRADIQNLDETDREILRSSFKIIRDLDD